MKKLLVGLVALLVLVMAFGVAMAIDVPEGAMIDEGQLDEITKVGNHMVEKEGRYLQYPDCTEYGIYEFDCAEESADTTHQHHIYLKPYGHTWASESGKWDWGIIEKPATCTEDGYAVDYCVYCGEKNPEKTRVIHMEHEYDDDHYVYHKEPTCTATGLGRHVCVHCGAPKDEPESEMVVVPMADHKWTKWNVEWSTCWYYGTATRTCEICDARQVLDAEHPVIYDHGKEVNIDDVNPLYNCGWDTHAVDKVFTNKAEFDAYITKLAADGLSFKVKRDVTTDCHDRTIVYTCTGCEGWPHKDFTVTLKYPVTDAHIWNDKPEEYGKIGVLYTEKMIKDQSFNNGEMSLKPTCLLPGFDLYFCKYDVNHGDLKASTTLTLHPADEWEGEKYIWKKVITPATGHKWSDWYEIETFDSEDPNKKVTRYVRTCETCGATENKNEIDDAFTGLRKDADGKWRYYENDVFVEKTDIIEFNGAKFWVIKGLLAQDATGLTICPDGKAWFLEQGRILEVSKIVSYGKDYFIVKNGALDVNANGLFDYDSSKFVFAAGKLRRDVNGLWQNPQDSKWYFLSQGQVQNNFSGVAEYNGHFFVIKGGVFDNSYNGTIEYDGHTFNVVDGELYDEVK